MSVFLIAIGALSGFLGGYLTSYFSEKAKNRAQLQDIKKLTEEKQKVESEFSLQTSRRKHQYEQKSTHYFKYFQLLDQLNGEQHKMIGDGFLPVLTKYFQDYIAADGDRLQEAVVVGEFSQNTQQILFHCNEGLIRFRGETNALKLISGPRVQQLLVTLNKQMDESLNNAGKFIQDMGALILSQQIEEMERRKQVLEAFGRTVGTTHEALIEAVREELNEI